MPWYYAGPEAKPVGPVSLEELHARRVGGSISPETYIIEHTGQPNDPAAWKRYREVFPSSPVIPPAPSQPALPILPPAPAAAAPPPPVASPIPAAQAPHPLFPSATPIGQQQVPTPAARPDPYYQVKPTNSWCAWGFGLSLAGLFFTVFACGLGIFLALPAFFICIYAWIQVHNKPEQAGRGLAIAGTLISGFTLIIFLAIALAIAIPAFKAHNLTVTEQSNSDSQ